MTELERQLAENAELRQQLNRVRAANAKLKETLRAFIEVAKAMVDEQEVQNEQVQSVDRSCRGQ